MMKADCANCKTHACYTKGVNCTGIDRETILESYNEEERRIMKAAAYVEGTFYSNITRLQETAEFAKAMGYKKLGMAFCIGLNAEARYIARYYEQQGFEFYSVCCKNCSFNKKELDLKQVKPELTHEAMCNPKFQAKILAEKGTELFISCGLCVGHDTIFNATDLIEKLISEQKKVIRFPLNGTWIDIGNPQEYQKANELVKHLH